MELKNGMSVNSTLHLPGPVLVSSYFEGEKSITHYLYTLQYYKLNNNNNRPPFGVVF